MGADPNVNSSSFYDQLKCEYPVMPLEFAACRGYIDIIKLLFAGSVKKIQCLLIHCSIFFAYRNRHKLIEAIELFLEKTIIIDSEWTQYLTTACCKGHLYIMELMLKRKTNVNHLPDACDTPLTIAVPQDFATIVDILDFWNICQRRQCLQ